MLTRNLWTYALTAVPETDLKAAADRVKSRYTVRHQALPEEGLCLLKMRDGALGEHYYIGEFPVASAHVELWDQQERVAAGGAHVMHDSADYAMDLAVCDAVMAGRLDGWEVIARLLEAGMQIRSEQQRRRKAMLARTRVDFDLLSAVTEGQDDD